MSTPPPILTLSGVADKLRKDFASSSKTQFILLYAFNGTGKTRLSIEFKNKGKNNDTGQRDTLYFNAFTEDLFIWDNDLENDRDRVLKMNSESIFFEGFQQLALEDKIFAYLERYADFNFKIDYQRWEIAFFPKDNSTNNIKISRGEETVFIWCIFLAICQLVMEDAEAYKWVKYIYIDDPVSSLDENNVIGIATDLSQLLYPREANPDTRKLEIKGTPKKIKTVISTHHTLFFNVMYNELKGPGGPRYFLLKKNGGYVLEVTKDTPFFHHISLLAELKAAVIANDIKTYHFNSLRSVMEKTAAFFGFSDFSACIYNEEDSILFARALNLLSHGQHSIYNPTDMVQDNKDLFKRILEAFLQTYPFKLK